MSDQYYYIITFPLPSLCDYLGMNEGWEKYHSLPYNNQNKKKGIKIRNNYCQPLMFSSSRIPVPRSAKRTPVETTLTIANNESPSQLKAARFNGGIHSPAKVAHPIAAVVAAANASPSIGVRRLSLAPTSKSPLATPPQRRSGSQRLSMYGVPHALGGERKATSSGLRRSATGTLMMASSPERERRIVVCVRKRPLSTKEGRLENEDCVTTDMNNNFIRVNVLRTKLDGLGKYYEDFEFGFDKVYDETCSNTLLYEQIVGPLIDFCLLGGKATCFAYGQTGSGKTHTMFHPKDGNNIYTYTHTYIYMYNRITFLMGFRSLL